jgi:hypothetical protein
LQARDAQRIVVVHHDSCTRGLPVARRRTTREVWFIDFAPRARSRRASWWQRRHAEFTMDRKT